MKIGLKRLEIMAQVGVLESELDKSQSLIIDLEVEGDFACACISDSMEDTVDYRELADICVQVATTKHHHLLEHFASSVIREIKSRFDVRVSITVRKPSALGMAACAYVRLEG